MNSLDSGTVFFDYPVTVAPADIDANHHANNVAYVRWVQEAATAHWEAAVPPEISREVSWVVLRHEIDYKKPAFLGETLRVRTWVRSMTALVSERHCQVWRDADGVLLAQVVTRWCAINPENGRPRRVDPRIPPLLGVAPAERG